MPGKCSAWTYYVCDEAGVIQRQLTNIPETGETTRVPDPIVKKLYRPEVLTDATAKEFLGLWDTQ